MSVSITITRPESAEYRLVFDVENEEVFTASTDDGMPSVALRADINLVALDEYLHSCCLGLLGDIFALVEGDQSALADALHMLQLDLADQPTT